MRRFIIRIEHNASSAYGSNWDIISPKGEDKVQCSDFERNQQSLLCKMSDLAFSQEIAPKENNGFALLHK